MLNFSVNGRSSVGRAMVSKTIGRRFEPFRPCKINKMEKLTLYIKESYHELVENVTWPTWSELVVNTIVVLIASVIFALIIYVMDIVSNQILSFLYGI